jgi:hypothetical protein
MRFKAAALVFVLLSTVAYADSVNETLWSATRSSSGFSNSMEIDEAIHLDVTAVVTESQPGNDTFISGVAEVQTLTFETKANSDPADYVVFYSAAGTVYALSLDIDSDEEPTGAVWLAIPAAQKSHCDVSAATTAAQVAEAAEVCIDAITGMTAAIVTDDTAANGTMTLTQVESGPTTNPNPQNADDSGNGGIAGVETTPGVAGQVGVASNLINAGDAFLTGLKVQVTTSSGLPTGISGSTDYWVIKIDGNNIKLASSYANAIAGTPVDVTAIGVGTQTLVVDTDLEGDIKLQKSNEDDLDDAVWIDITNSTTAIDAAGTFNWTVANAGFKRLRAAYVGDSSEATITLRVNGK